MLIYAAADIHGSQFRLNLMLDQIEKHKPDLVVICGDITQFGPEDVATNFLDQIPVETYAISGNIDPANTGKAIERSHAKNLELRVIRRKKIKFLGIGGIPAGLDLETLFSMDGGHVSLKKILDAYCVVVSHVPPYGAMDRVFLGHHAGNKPLRELVDMFHPCLVICGHIHENPGFTKVGETVVVNCSMGKKTEGALIDVADSVSVRTLG